MPRPFVHPYPQSGFSLIELSIVLVIIGLIIGGIFIGRDLIRTSQLNSVASEVGRYTQAIADFREKYHALPGDFSGATGLWGSADGVIPSDAACTTTVGTGTQTCDGNGDGRISRWWASTGTETDEMYRAWQHLANAGLIDGHYTGVAGPISTQNGIIGVNIPASKLPGAGYNITSLIYNEGVNNGWWELYYPANYLHFFQFGGVNTISGNSVAAVLTTAEALSLDQKLDDGYPGSGKVMSFIQGNMDTPHCTTSANASTARYDTSRSGVQCAMLFLLGF